MYSVMPSDTSTRCDGTVTATILQRSSQALMANMPTGYDGASTTTSILEAPPNFLAESDWRPPNGQSRNPKADLTNEATSYPILTGDYYTPGCRDPRAPGHMGRYELRQNPGLSRGTWLDNDQSGDFDPNARVPPSRKRKRSASRVQRQEAQKFRQEERERLHQAATELCTAYTHTKCPLVATFKIGMANSATLDLVCQMPDRWPKDACTFNTIRSDHDPREVHDLGTRSARRRNINQVKRPDLIGHVEARGCWSCYDLGQRCSIVHDDIDFHYPCEACIETGEDCELVRAPLRKRACEVCKRSSTPCSYASSTTTDWSLPCGRCAQKGFNCVAGPARGHEPLRISYARPPSARKLAEREAAQKVDDRRRNEAVQKAALSLAVASSAAAPLAKPAVLPREAPQSVLHTPVASEAVPPMPCAVKPTRHVSPTATADQPQALPFPTVNVEDKARHEPLPIDSALALMRRPISDNPGQKPELTPRSPEQRRMMKSVAQTAAIKMTPPKATQTSPAQRGLARRDTESKPRLAQPILFNQPDCDFCSNPSHAILGPTPKSNAAINNNPATPAPGPPGTKLCPKCTLARMQTFVCRPHHLEPLTGCTHPLRFAGAFARLLAGARLATDAWCSLCPSLAVVRCRGKGAGHGCGLLLCNSCAAGLRDDMGLLGPTLEKMEDVPSGTKPLGLRADVDLLRTEGALAGFFRAQVARRRVGQR